MPKQRYPKSFVATFLLIICTIACLMAPLVSHASTQTGPPDAFKTMPGLDELQNDSTQWNIFHDQGYTKGRLQNIQQEQGTMKVTLMHGTKNYADILSYRDLPSSDGAQKFMMNVSFLFHNADPAQGLEFTMDKWVNGVRWEWALQWQVVPDGTALQGAAQSWRFWNGSNWLPMGVVQNLEINKWHSLQLYGEIVNGQVHYVGFKCDGIYTNMNQLTFAPAVSSGDKLSVGVQLDGDYHEQSYPIYYRDIDLHYQ